MRLRTRLTSLWSCPDETRHAKRKDMTMEKYLARVVTFAVLVGLMASCAPKYGCPSNGKNVGAERILEGGKVPKAKKMKV